MEKIFVVMNVFIQTLQMIHYFVHIEGKIAPAVSIRELAGSRPEFGGVTGTELVMGLL